MEKFKISDIQELFATDVERFHSLTHAHVTELLTQTPPPPEALDEALRQAHTLKGLAATVEAWGLSCLGADLEKLLELAGSWMPNEPEKARAIFEFILEHLQDWFVMNQFTCMDMLPQAWDIYQGLRRTMDERWPGYLPSPAAGPEGANQYVRLEELELGDGGCDASSPVPERDVRDAQPAAELSAPTPLRVVPPTLRHREEPAAPLAVENRDVQQSEAIAHTTAPSAPKPLPVVPPTLRRKDADVGAASTPAVLPTAAQSEVPPAAKTPSDTAAAAAPEAPLPRVEATAQSHPLPPHTPPSLLPLGEGVEGERVISKASPPILRVAPPTLKRRGNKPELEKTPIAEVSCAPAPVESAPVVPPPIHSHPLPPHTPPSLLPLGEGVEGERVNFRPPAVEPLVVAQSADEPPVTEPSASALPVVSPQAGEPPALTPAALGHTDVGPSDEDTALFAPPPDAVEQPSTQESEVRSQKSEVISQTLDPRLQTLGDADLLEMLGQEVAGYLSELTGNLTELAANLADQTAWEKTRRLFHTIKGTAATFHLDAISAPAKAAEAHCIVATEDAHARTREAFETCVQRAQLVAKALALPFNEKPLYAALDRALAKAAMLTTAEATTPTTALDPEMAGFFIRDARDQIEIIEQALLRWEALGDGNSGLASGASLECVQAVQRGFHTLKGAGNSIGLTAVAQSVHEVEAFLEGVAGAGAAGSRALFTFLFGAVDQLRQYLAELTKNTASPWRNDWTTALRLLCQPEEAVSTETAAAAAKVVQAALVTEAPDDDSHTLRIDADRLYQLMNLIGEMVVDRSRLARKLEQLATLHRFLAERNAALTASVQTFQKQFEFNLIQSQGQAAEARGQQPAAEGQAIERRAANSDAGAAEFSELEFDRYDQFNVLARSLVEISHDIEHLNEEVAVCLDSFAAENVQFTQTSQELQSKVTSLSLVPASTLFPRLQRAFRDALSVEGKDAELTLSGGEALLDKVVVDKVYAPLLHLLRNAVAHGIEHTATREKRKKPVRGQVRLSAAQMSNQVVIQIEDDGAGVDAKAVRKRAVEKGWLPKHAPGLTPEQVVHYIFQPGFSTATKVTSVSGRGIGLDVVRKEIENLNGSVELKYEAERGSIWTLRLPLTLAISEAILAEVRGTTFAFPLNFIESGLVLDEPTTRAANGREMFPVPVRRQNPEAGVEAPPSEPEAPKVELLPVVRLSKLFQLPGGEDANKGLIVSVGDRRAIVVVDVVLLRQEIVVKQLDSVMTLHPLLNGATLNAEGQVIPILNLPMLLKFGEQDPTSAGRQFTRPETTKPTGQLRVLIVDDSLSVRKVQERYLTEIGCKVTSAADGLYALEKLREQEFDFIFTDLEMPRLNGYELISELRGNPAWAGLPIVVVSSRGADKYITKAMNLGATTFLTKPFTQSQLQQVLGHYYQSAKVLGDPTEPMASAQPAG